MLNDTDLQTLSEECFSDLVKFIHELTGITIGKNRNTMLQGRLRKRIRELKLICYEDYLQFAKANKDEQVVFIDLVTTNETQFFRTPRIWNYLEKTFLPQWFENNPQKIMSIWSAAASSGEEAHSLAIICQLFKDNHPNFNYKIFGSDISKDMIGHCKEGIFSGRSIENFKSSRPDDFARFLKPIDGQKFQATTEIRSKIQFFQHNLFRTLATAERFDLVLLRNVLIYFSKPDQEVVLAKILPRMHEDGILVIGESESLTHIQTQFKSVEPLVYTSAQNAKSSEAA